MTVSLGNAPVAKSCRSDEIYRKKCERFKASLIVCKRWNSSHTYVTRANVVHIKQKDDDSDAVCVCVGVVVVIRFRRRCWSALLEGRSNIYSRLQGSGPN